MNWIEEIHHDLASRERSEMLQLHREAVRKVKRPAMWRELLRCVRSEINLHQQAFAGRQEIKVKVDPGDQGFSLRKSEFPSVTVRCDFLGGRLIELRFSYLRTENADKIEWEEQVDFHVDELDRVQFQHKGEILIDPRDVCKMVLLPILNTEFKPPEQG